MQKFLINQKGAPMATFNHSVMDWYNNVIPLTIIWMRVDRNIYMPYEFKFHKIELHKVKDM